MVVSNPHPGRLATRAPRLVSGAESYCISGLTQFTSFLTMGTFVPFPGSCEVRGCASLKAWAHSFAFPCPEFEPNANEARGKNEEDVGRLFGFEAHDQWVL